MDRRTFLKTTTAVAATSTAVGTAHAQQSAEAFPAPASHTARRELRVGVPSSPYLADAALTLMRDIEIASEGRIVLRSIETASPGTSIASGQTNAAFGHITEICSAPELALFSGLPGDLALSPDTLLTWHTAAAGDMYLDEAAAHFGLTALVAGHGGPSTGLWASHEFDNLRGFATAEISTIGLGKIVSNELTEAFGEPIGKTRLVEATTAPLDAISEVPEANRQTWYNQSIHDQGHAISFVIARDAWYSLTPGDQLLIKTIADAAAHRDLARISASNRLVAPAVLANLSLVRKPLPADVVAAIRHTSRQVVHQEFSRIPRMQPAFQAYQAFFEAMTGLPMSRPTGGLV